MLGHFVSLLFFAAAALLWAAVLAGGQKARQPCCELPPEGLALLQCSCKPSCSRGCEVVCRSSAPRIPQLRRDLVFGFLQGEAGLLSPPSVVPATSGCVLFMPFTSWVRFSFGLLQPLPQGGDSWRISLFLWLGAFGLPKAPRSSQLLSTGSAEPVLWFLLGLLIFLTLAAFMFLGSYHLPHEVILKWCLSTSLPCSRLEHIPPPLPSLTGVNPGFCLQSPLVKQLVRW